MKECLLNFKVHSLFLLLSILVCSRSEAQLPEQWSSAQILHQMQGLNTLGSVLYLAAHPDDENTRFISYCVNEKHIRTAYLSLTRGDGGQNLIGKEIGPELGVIRTNELMMARSVDGGMQYFTPSIDFGYSKSPEETLAIWGEDEVLQDVVRVIRHFRPDVIVCRFPTDGGGGHGHHTASALLAQRAFDLAADESYDTDGLKAYGTWQPHRIVVNTGRWWNDSISADDPGVVVEDVGAYVEVLGTSCNELAALSRSQHKSQGFGSTGVRGSHLEYFEHMAGEAAEQSLFDGMDFSWSRVKGGSEIQRALDSLLETYDPQSPSLSVEKLMDLKRLIASLPNSNWKKSKAKKVDALLGQCMGIYAEAVSQQLYGLSGDSVHVDLEFNARGVEGVRLISVQCSALSPFSIDPLDLKKNETHDISLASVLDEKLLITNPYWLEQEGSFGRFQVANVAQSLKPVSEPAIVFTATFEKSGQQWTQDLPLIHKWNDPVDGESWEPFVIRPEVTVSFSDDNLFLLSDAKVKAQFKVAAQSTLDEAEIHLEVPEGWVIEQHRFDISGMKAGEERSFHVELSASVKEGEGQLEAFVSRKGGKEEVLSMTRIEYDHIPTQTIFRPAALRLVKMNVKREGGRIGYIPGAGDKVAESLTALGYEVDILDEQAVKSTDLSVYKAILTGIRLVNVDDRIAIYLPELFAYAKSGGNLIMQYNTRHRLKTETFSPYPIKLSRDRVTEEDSEVRFLAPDHPVMHSPNAIGQADFMNWVQERGLYFPEEWDEVYTPIFSWNDVGETPKEGALLIAPHGKGNYVYTGVSFFRELPAGVPGAYRLLVNLIELPSND